MNYRHAGRQRTLYIGKWPEVSIVAARDLREEARRQLAAGLDPVDTQREAERRAQMELANTFKAVAEEWVEKSERDGLSQVTLDKIRWLLSMAYPVIGTRPIAQITPFEALGVLRKVEANGRLESARRMRSVLSRVFRYGIATARADRDVVTDLRGALSAPKVRHRAAITEAADVGKLLAAIDGYGGRGTTLIALRLLPHVFVRPGELRTAEWEEFDTEAAVWTIPASKMKMRRPHRVPLSRQALRLIDELRPLSGYQRYLFPAQGAIGRPMCENTITVSLRRLGYGKEEMTAHGFRAMAATLLNEMGRWNPDAIERQLAHMDGNQVRQVYARGQYWDERVGMMQDWSDYLDRLRFTAKSRMV
jgi:integrase